MYKGPEAEWSPASVGRRQKAKDKVAQDERRGWGLDHTATGDNTLPAHSRGSHPCQSRGSSFLKHWQGSWVCFQIAPHQPGPDSTHSWTWQAHCSPSPKGCFSLKRQSWGDRFLWADPPRQSSQRHDCLGHWSWLSRAESSPDPPASTSKKTSKLLPAIRTQHVAQPRSGRGSSGQILPSEERGEVEEGH